MFIILQTEPPFQVHFREIGHIFHYKYILIIKKHFPRLKSCLNDSETLDRGLKGVKIKKIS